MKSLKNYLIPALLSLIVGILLWQIQRDVVSLEYNLTESEVFPRENGVGRFFVVDIINTGTKEIQNITFKIDFSSGFIETYKFSNKDLVTDLSQDKTEIEGKIPLLNESEKISLTVTSTHPKGVSSPVITARAVGVTATQTTDEPFSYYLRQILAPVTGIAVALTLVSIWSSIKQVRVTESVRDIEVKGSEIESLFRETEKKRTEWEKEHEKRMADIERYEKDQEQGKPDRQQLIFTLLNKHRLSHVFVDILRRGGEISYRDTAFHIVYSMLLDETEEQNHIKALEELSGFESIAPVSKGLIMYLCGKSLKYIGKDLDSDIWFNKCKEVTPLMHQHLMENDRFYDLKNVRDYLKS